MSARAREPARWRKVRDAKKNSQRDRFIPRISYCLARYLIKLWAALSRNVMEQVFLRLNFSLQLEHTACCAAGGNVGLPLAIAGLRASHKSTNRLAYFCSRDVRMGRVPISRFSKAIQ